MTPRDRMVLSCVLPRGVQLSAEDTARLARQFGMTAERVKQMAARLFSEIASSGRDLEACQPKADRFPH